MVVVVWVVVLVVMVSQVAIEISPISVALPSKVCVCGRLLAGSNPIGGMDVSPL